MVTAKRRAGGYAAAKPTMDELLASRQRMNRVSAEFLKTDLQTALTFVKIAQQTGDDSRKKRNCRAARKAYDTVLHLVQKIELSPADKLTVRQGLLQLKTELEDLGETF